MENFTLGNSTMYAVVSGGEIHAFFVSAYLPESPAPYLTGIDEIKSSLGAYYRARGYSPLRMDELAITHAEMQGLNRARDSGEGECRRLAGTDRYPCESFTSCRLACFASPFCPNFIYGGKLGEFVYVIWNFENSSRKLGDAYRHENESFAALAGNQSADSARDYLSSIDRLNLAATKVNFDPLFAYSFCFKPDYALANITRLQLSAQRNLENASFFFSMPEEAGKIRNRTLEILERQRKLSQPAAAENFSSQPVAAPKPALGTSNQSGQPAPEGLPEKPYAARGVPYTDAASLMAMGAIDAIGLLLLAIAIAVSYARRKNMEKPVKRRRAETGAHRRKKPARSSPKAAKKARRAFSLRKKMRNSALRKQGGKAAKGRQKRGRRAFSLRKKLPIFSLKKKMRRNAKAGASRRKGHSSAGAKPKGRRR
ncbi:MAG: hypothetical protein WC263_03435 [Candidatus Micrarchaeia archaeon]